MRKTLFTTATLCALALSAGAAGAASLAPGLQLASAPFLTVDGAAANDSFFGFGFTGLLDEDVDGDGAPETLSVQLAGAFTLTGGILDAFTLSVFDGPTEIFSGDAIQTGFVIVSNGDDSLEFLITTPSLPLPVFAVVSGAFGDDADGVFGTGFGGALGTDATLTITQVVPLPGALPLLAGGLGALAALRVGRARSARRNGATERG